jgi:diguanylate cyclase (GGDEF)-like protein
MDAESPTASGDVDGRTIASGSGIDELTQINDRRAFFMHAQAVFSAALERGLECTAVIVDLDRLEHVNDTYGHHAGSELIRETAAALAGIADEGDVVGRLGGDELALVRLGGGSGEALRREIAAGLARASRADRPYGLAVSVGVAIEDAAEAGSLDSLMARADDAMYGDKRARGGRSGPPHARRSPRRQA